LEISEELKKELNELEESLGASKTALTDETPSEEVIERVIELVNKYSKKPKRVILIAVTVDGVVTKAKAGALAENANVGELATMVGSLKPFRA
jgi:predicted NBD/HSP70 family sugar kinase